MHEVPCACTRIHAQSVVAERRHEGKGKRTGNGTHSFGRAGLGKRIVARSHAAIDSDDSISN